jgi:pyrroline-5-carboxylate reductase
MTLRLAGPLLLVGAGKMGGALLEGWLRQGLDPSAVFIQDPAPPPGTAVVRAMPNVAASVGRSMTAACANAAVTRDQALECTMLLEAIGDVMWIDDETQLDAITAVSGSGPAYVFLLAECLEEAGRAAGLDAALARQLARATVEGAGELLSHSDLSPRELREKVTSPQGVTAAALQVLMGEDAVQDLLTRAIAAAAKRSREFIIGSPRLRQGERGIGLPSAGHQQRLCSGEKE